uniref:Uncharacterized protein n=1 Tax=Magnetococcus massalia (strain MO-1) TaxID=451514 RepID=A0A1S7LEY5_MAGMO|nr:conserved protein of unknown function [Candidatus Magnetococcus massalia]
MTTKIFTPGPTAALAATETTSRVALPGAGSQVRVVNSSENMAFIQFGDSAVEATTGAIPLPAGLVEVFSNPLNTNSHVAAICASGETASLYFTTGDGV